jgi:hypothetical protein
MRRWRPWTSWCRCARSRRGERDSRSGVAISPITPVTTPPTPGTAVNVDNRSIAERMNVMLSAAWLLLGLYVVVIASFVLMAATTVRRFDAAPTPPLKALAVADSWRWLALSAGSVSY